MKSYSIQCVGDVNSGGGIITSSLEPVVSVNGHDVSVSGSPVAAHASHPSTTTSGGVLSMVINGIPLNIEGEEDLCGHVRLEGMMKFVEIGTE